MPVTSITLGVTVIEQVALSPFEVSAVIVASPMLNAVTKPFSSTLTISLFDELQMILLLAALSGVTVAFSCNVDPISMFAFVVSIDMPVTSTGTSPTQRVKVLLI